MGVSVGVTRGGGGVQRINECGCNGCGDGCRGGGYGCGWGGCGAGGLWDWGVEVA